MLESQWIHKHGWIQLWLKDDTTADYQLIGDVPDNVVTEAELRAISAELEEYPSIAAAMPALWEKPLRGMRRGRGFLRHKVENHQSW